MKTGQIIAGALLVAGLAACGSSNTHTGHSATPTSRPNTTASTPATASTAATASTPSTPSTTSTTTAAPATTVAPTDVVEAPLARGTVDRTRILAAAEHTLSANSLRVRADLLAQVNGTTTRVAVTGSVDSNGGTFMAVTAAGTIDAVFRGADVWVTATSPAFRQALPAGKSWIEGTTMQLGELGRTAVAEAAATVNLVHGITRLYHAPAGTARFRFSVPRALRMTPVSQRALLARAFSVKAAGFAEFGTLSIGSDGGVRSATFHADGHARHADFRLTDTLLLDTSGGPVSATPPSSADVVPVSAVPSTVTALENTLTGRTAG